MRKLDPMNYLQAPEWTLDKAKAEEFEAMYQAALASDPGSFIKYRSRHPKYEFLAYLVEQKKVLLHGSNNGSIEVLQPKRQVNYLGQIVKAIFAAADPVWPMFFALLDREVYQGSIRNGCFMVWNKQTHRKCYHFSINADMLEQKPWTNGTIYILPCDKFEQEKDPSGEWLEEWISEKLVKPLAKLAVSPEDFPFLEQVQGHDEELLDQIDQVHPDLANGFHDVIELKNGYGLTYVGDHDWDSRLVEFIRHQRKASPHLTYELIFEPNEGPIRLHLRGPKEAREELKDKLSSFLDARNVPG
jgi:hypothetical protein